MKRENTYQDKGRSNYGKTNDSKPNMKNAFFEKKVNGKSTGRSDDFFTNNTSKENKTSQSSSRGYANDSSYKGNAENRNGGYKSFSNNSEGGYKGKTENRNGGYKSFGNSTEGGYKGKTENRNGGYKSFGNTTEGGYKGKTENRNGGYKSFGNTTEGGYKGNTENRNGGYNNKFENKEGAYKKFTQREEPVYKSTFKKSDGERPTYKDYNKEERPAYKGTKDENFSKYEKKTGGSGNYEERGERKSYSRPNERGEGFKKTFENKTKSDNFGKSQGGFNTLNRNKTTPFKGRFEEKVATVYQDEYIEYSHNKRQRIQDQLPAEGEQMPLNKYVARCGICGRREAVELIKAGKVKVNGKVWTEPSYHVLANDVIFYNEQKIIPQENLMYVLLNKPKDFITTLSDEQGRKTVMDLVANACDERIYPVGRLDRNTSGLLLLTNDGALAQKLMHPSFVIKKIYQVGLNKPLEKTDYDKIRAGLTLEDGVAHVDDLAYIDAKDNSKIGIQIHIGKNRIVRRIFESLGYDVEMLDRVLYANLTKKNLPRGKWRFLDEKEIRILKHFNSK